MAEETITSDSVVAKMDRVIVNLRLLTAVYQRTRDYIVQVTDAAILAEMDSDVQSMLDDLGIKDDESTEPYDDVEGLRNEFGPAATDLLLYIDAHTREGEPLTLALVEQAIASIS